MARVCRRLAPCVAHRKPGDPDVSALWMAAKVHDKADQMPRGGEVPDAVPEHGTSEQGRNPAPDPSARLHGRLAAWPPSAGLHRATGE